MDGAGGDGELPVTDEAANGTTATKNSESASLVDDRGADDAVTPSGGEETQPPGAVRRRLRTLTFGRRHGKAVASKTGSGVVKEVGGGRESKKRSGAAGGGGGKMPPWSGFKFNYRLKRGGGGGPPATLASIPEPNASSESCVCTGYRRTEEHHLGAGVVFRAASEATTSSSSPSTTTPAEQRQRRPPATIGEPSRRPSPGGVPGQQPMFPFIDLSRFNPDDYPIEDWDERARAVRARELEEGVEPPPGYRPASSTSSSVVVGGGGSSLSGIGARVLEFDLHLDELFADFQSRLIAGARFAVMPQLQRAEEVAAEPRSLPASSAAASDANVVVHVTPQRTVHTQVDYIHCLVPDLREITDCSFYWGKMDRYEAERLLESRPEGTFLLRDSAQEEFLFSVSFRRYGRSLHARIEQFKHRFSFDSHDPGVFASDTVCGLIDHYKDPSCCMFFEPMLTLPLHRTFPFPLQHLCRAAISEACTYDGINSLRLPKSLKGYLKEYHYKQRVRVRRFEVEQ